LCTPFLYELRRLLNMVLLYIIGVIVKRRVAILVSPRRFEIIEEDVPSIGREDVLIKVRACGICTGDIYAFLGYPVWFSLPAAMGHEPAGEVIDVGKDVVKVSKGDHVFALASPGFSDYIVVNQRDVERIPNDIPFEYAIGEPIVCVVNALRSLPIRFGDSVAVVGTGFMGLLLIQGLRHMGLEILAGIDINDERLKLAKLFGADIVLNPNEIDIEREAMKITGGRGFDIVIEATGNPSGVGIATKLVRRRGILGIFSYHPNPVSVNFREWDAKGLEIIMTVPARVSPEDRDRNIWIAA